MGEFFQTLREIQKKERNNGTLAKIEDTFYKDIQKYLDDLRTFKGDPFSQKYLLLKDVQRIATEICERREHKITDAAVVNIHRSYHLFSGKPQFDLVDTTPLNLTPEEEKFYFSLIDSLASHRKNISLEKLSSNDDGEPIEKLSNPKNNFEHIIADDEVLSQINEIISAKTFSTEKYEPIEKQIAKSDSSKQNNENDVFKSNDEFIDLESHKISKDIELVTMLIFDKINQIIAVDNKIYGPFYPQDLVVMPKINAKIIVKGRRGRIINI